MEPTIWAWHPLPGRSGASAIIIPDRMKDVQRHGRSADRADAVENAAGDAPDVAGADDPRHAADRELELARDHQAHLLVGMSVQGDDRIRLEADGQKHHLF